MPVFVSKQKFWKYSHRYYWIEFSPGLLKIFFQTAQWRLISGTLGGICLFLMVTLGVLLKIQFTQQSVQSTSSPGPNLEIQKGSDCCSCQEKWTGYQCNCYFFSNEKNTWEESRDFCVSQNSTLLQLKSNEEFIFKFASENLYWIGLSYDEARGAWLWLDGSAFSQHL
ncbi:PREDICTED: natural killer cells antigen CD94-like [Elephantulus edwardii]|uniref:natural killer cells antigen CD94-like n=1 Tax=Elephantulus edwardii TaxID=28737 RepID=UPI0003F06553|nr:PREDICTED: natural killer cells antigen CD94-like [Elephantulus edwardii]